MRDTETFEQLAVWRAPPRGEARVVHDVTDEMHAGDDRTAQLVPTGTAKLEIVADTTVRTAGGLRRIRLAMIRGPGPVPAGVWLDERGELFASEMGWFVTVRPGHAPLLPALRAIELRYRNGEGEALARRLAPPVSPSLAIVGGDLFDSERGVMMPRRTVVVRDGRITAVGSADSVTVPPGATVIDAAGKTVMPGMWDMHTHLFHPSQLSSGPAQLATGVTTIRALAADIDVAVSHRDRAESGAILSPRIIPGNRRPGTSARTSGPGPAILRSSRRTRVTSRSTYERRSATTREPS